MLGVSGQAAQQRFSATTDESDPVLPQQRVLRRVTAFNEVSVLDPGITSG